MLMKISKLNLSYLTKSCRHALSPNEKILRHIYFFVAFCDNGDRQREPCLRVFLEGGGAAIREGVLIKRNTVLMARQQDCSVTFTGLMVSLQQNSSVSHCLSLR